MAEQLWTIGHSTHTQLQLMDLLQQHNMQVLVDVRTIPRSTKNPQFNKDTLSEVLPQQHGIKYVWMGKELGGLRKRNKDMHCNDGWENFSFRGYADYMQTDAFRDGIEQLKQLAAAEGPAAVMCAEAMYFSCHRRLISDVLTVSGWKVWHIMPQANKPPAQHTLTAFARVEGDKITYPVPAAAAAAAAGTGTKRDEQSCKKAAAARRDVLHTMTTRSKCAAAAAHVPKIAAADSVVDVVKNSAKDHCSQDQQLETSQGGDPAAGAAAGAAAAGAAAGVDGDDVDITSRRRGNRGRKQLKIDQLLGKQRKDNIKKQQ